jgi:L-ascorbate metabolism protein UlaG (beta-lactamase superfamily)
MLQLTLALLPTLCPGSAQDAQGEGTPDTGAADPAAPRPGKIVEVTYLGNEGFMLESANRAALVDAFVDHTPEDKHGLTEEVIEELGQTRGLFENVLQSFTTHYHEGGLLTDCAMSFQLTHQRTIMWMVPEAVAEITAAWNYEERKFPARIKPQMPDPADWHKFGWGTLNAVFMNIPHAGPGAVKGEHVAHVIRVGGVKFFFAGHAIADPKTFSVYAEFIGNVHVAVVPYRYLIDEKSCELLQKQVAPRHIIPTGIPVEEFEEISKSLAKRFDNLVLFEEPLEKHTIEIKKRD